MKLFIVTTIIFLTFLQTLHAKPYTMLVSYNVLFDYKNFIKGKDVLQIKEYGGEHSRRDVIEMVLFQQALHLGGHTEKVEFKIADNIKRRLDEISSGNATTSYDSVWLSDLVNKKNQLYISQPVIRNGEFEAGFYIMDNMEEIFKVTKIEEIRQLVAVCNSRWSVDWKTLEFFNPKEIVDAPLWSAMVAKLLSKQADFLLVPFQPTKDFSLIANNQRLIPIKGFKIGLEGSRHFVISKKYPNSKKIFTALQKGLDILRKEGRIVKAFQESGFFNLRTKNWIKAN